MKTEDILTGKTKMSEIEFRKKLKYRNTEKTSGKTIPRLFFLKMLNFPNSLLEEGLLNFRS